jgi:hypothetical protein
MTWVETIHSWFITPTVTAVILAASMASAVVGWVLARGLAPRAPKSGLAALAVGRASLWLLGAVVLCRVGALLGLLPAGGPRDWLTVVGTLPGGWFPIDAVLVLALVHAAWFPLACVVEVRRLASRDPEAMDVPMPGALAAALALVGPAGWYLAWGQLGQQSAQLAGLDLVAVAPLMFTALAVGAGARDELLAIEAAVEKPEIHTPEGAPDVPQLWSDMGALASREPTFRFEGTRADPVASEARSAWHAAGGRGLPPVVLDVFLAEGDRPGTGRLVPDLPSPTDHILLAACIYLAVHAHGTRVLVVSDRSSVLEARTLAALAQGGVEPQVVSGATALRDALAAGDLPDVVFLDPHELSERVLRAVSDPRNAQGRRWLGALGLLMMPHIDRGRPIHVTHRAFTLRRLQLALTAAHAQPSLLATGFDGRGTERLLRRAFPQITTKIVPLRPRQTTPTQAWLVAFPFFDAAATPWPRRAVAPIVEGGRTVHVGDPTGAFADEDVAIWDADVKLSRGVTLGGTASVSLLDDVWLVAAFRAMRHRVPSSASGHGTHHALWGLRSDPVTRFLVADDNLANLLQSGRLPPPQPVVGHANRALGRAHLRGAVRDGIHDLRALTDAFGHSLVEELVREEGTVDQHVTARDTDGRAVRSQQVRVRPDVVHESMRPTVTDRAITLVDRDSSLVLGTVDALTAPTRFYPRRVFAWQGRRYEVPLHGLDVRRGRLEVRAVAASQPLTAPRLAVRATPRQALSSPQHVRSGTLEFQLASFDLIAHEAVSGVRRGATESITYEDVTCRYRTRVPGLFFPRARGRAPLHHLARSFEGALRSHLLIEEDDVEVVPVDANWWEGLPAGILIVDRHVQGMGVAEALNDAMARSVLEWVYAILGRCTCARGCKRCTPWDVLEYGMPDKQGVLDMLGG